MRTFRLFSMVALALAMAACSNEDNELENVTPAQQGMMHFTATVAAPGNGDVTRTVYTEVTEGTNAGTINVAWKAGDEICITDDIYNSLGTVTVGTPAADGSAAISGTITGSDGDDVLAFYPATAMTDEAAFFAKYNEQEGTLDYIQNNLDLRMGMGTLSESGTEATLADNLEMESMIAIWKLTLQDNAATPAALSATKVTIKNGSTVIASTTNISGTSTVYLALPITSVSSFLDITIIIMATVGSDTYTYSKSGVTLKRGKYYQSTVTMEKQASVPTGALSGKFSVSATKKVYFSKGNLQYKRSTNTWSFMEHQFSTVETTDQDVGTDYTSQDVVSLFGWGTGNNPQKTSSNNSDYGTFTDWGSNSDLQSALGTGWRTLTSEEWTYLFNTRSASTVDGTDNVRYVKAKVNDVQGVILFPDSYTHPSGVTAVASANTANAAYWTNSWSVDEWSKMETAGCVFLPAAGLRDGTSVYVVGSSGYYWSSTADGTDKAYYVYFASDGVDPANHDDFYSRYYGFSVRLVKDAE